eukprot:CAMPEP_0117006418 /NCGR_PEP_ID=MMETSP0472-20121206/6654_1 /TAXON_ID=693140 ORGANISM="Tiarina fusus, Strain LIS" /NCGR_SAMPLE_ID=MMETSP0472 /ASSEMBLY_ACC=CAM_ASM_000603 /LENGTH=452 /DNA_ID=CAMNT_0004707879 /DNA_START=465 /DNA_END=1823 /DNA_ORIENTATION=-
MRRFCAKSCDSCLDSQGDSDLCVDDHENCAFWAESGECTNNPKYMKVNCAKSCNSCTKKPKPTVPNRATLGASSTEVGEEDKLAIVTDSAKYGTQQTADGSEWKQTLVLVQATSEYMESEQVTALPSKIRDNCKNQNELCSFWAIIGECEKNKSFMKVNCAPACKTCHLIDMKTRCPPLENAAPALRPGDLNKMFERIVSTAPGNITISDEDKARLNDEGMTEYSVVVLSRPLEGQAHEISLSNDMSLPPWVITFEDFLTPEECDAMVRLGYKSGYKRSEDVGATKIDGTVDSKQSHGRTSENAWCSSRDGCRDDEVAARIHNRISKVTNIPPENSEDIQLLRYEVGQFYNTHHDYIPHQRDRQCGPRILTFFMYLSDVEAGGGTDFPNLGITVMPKKGRGLLWPSVYDSAPMSDDKRMQHQALPVEKGTKFAANGWIHQFDYLAPQATGCN